ncbi:TetR/AcrR family transcriptional regulator C-terminal domain-containing protein [Nocardia iowensis]|uniref:TetR/AcrR family transcriptional regulator C-terminal domain-containing protein n=1 Tax=Nocardia iowensis TaxID=204891 RepID=A0ABX8RJI2_NOCIO|nr:TetR/AcrR family transcriptional regulator C-terminal domain-containing protein [Nocardia iowensis]QXN89501.1 TetR/AcrR family transcriptional regulator C-terminal domain-containing protein [Nocardia iowensis]
MKLDTQVIAQAALELLDEVGLDGLTMRKVAAALDVQAPALYWHVKNKRELLDAMARTVFVGAVGDLEAPRQGEGWQDWMIELATRLRRAMLRYRDGAKVLAGTYVHDEALWRTVELTLRTLEDAGFSMADAGRVFPLLLHYTTGFVIEEQARTGVDYDSNPYRLEHIEQIVDTTRYPLTARMVIEFAAADFDTEFDHGLRVILAGIRTTRTNPVL